MPREASFRPRSLRQEYCGLSLLQKARDHVSIVHKPEPVKVYPKLDRDGEVIKAGLFGNSFTSLDSWEINKGRLDDALFSFACLDDLFREAKRQS